MDSNIVALDVGEQRVGVAIARDGLQVALPLTTLDRQAADFWETLAALLKEHHVSEVVIGLPRGLDGQESAQTAAAQAFGTELSAQTETSIHWQDEALTSVKAEAILKQQGKPYAKSDIDTLAASLILTDYLETRQVAS